MPEQSNSTGGAGAVPAVVVLASDPLARDGTTSFMAAGGRVEVLPEGRLAHADVVVMITADVTGRTLADIGRVSRVTERRARIVLVADRIGEPHLAFAVRHGLTEFLVRPRTSFTQIVTAAVDSHRGGQVLRARTPSALIARLRTARDGGTQAGATPTGLAPREIDVLRLLAEGKDVMEIATELRYSERLIKSVIHTVVKRYGLRNRTHAVAHAIRTGIL
ncbi:response regulator transcription factor [Streptomyces flaveolus]|uniref:response regulator transcription factor n=1 Tax=Streptomyces flaveolus TaxID=67297 RepID=UPI0036F6333D